MQQLTIQDVARLLGISVVQAANNERAGTLPLIRVGNFYTDAANAIDAYLGNRATGYQEADTRAQDAALKAADRRLEAEQAEQRRINREHNQANEAVRQRNEAARSASLEVATGMRYA